MKNCAKIGFLLGVMAVSSWALGDVCMAKRLPRDKEYRLMHVCIENNCAQSLTYEEFEDKLKACSCYISALICEQDEKKLLQEDPSEKSCPVVQDKERAKKRYEKCLNSKK